MYIYIYIYICIHIYVYMCIHIYVCTYRNASETFWCMLLAMDIPTIGTCVFTYQHWRSADMDFVHAAPLPSRVGCCYGM